MDNILLPQKLPGAIRINCSSDPATGCYWFLIEGGGQPSLHNWVADLAFLATKIDHRKTREMAYGMVVLSMASKHRGLQVGAPTTDHSAFSLLSNHQCDGGGGDLPSLRSPGGFGSGQLIIGWPALPQFADVLKAAVQGKSLC